MLDEILRISGLNRETLIPEIRAVHQKYGTSEYSFLIEGLPSLRPLLKGKQATEMFAPAIEAYREQRRQNLKLFPTVAETLLKIKGRGTRIIGYTESMGFYSNYRVRRLGLDGVLDYVFCPEDHVLPPGLTPETLRAYPTSHYELRYTKQLFTEREKKPDTVVLNAIISDLGLVKSDCEAHMNWSARKTVQRRFLVAVGHAIYVTWPVLSVILAIQVTLGLLIGFVEGWSVGDAVYFTFITSLTIGYGDVVPRQALGRALAVGIGICGLFLTGVIAGIAVYAMRTALGERDTG